VILAALVGLAMAGPQPTDHTLLYYNARMALREGNAVEAVKLWLLRNALEEVTGEVSVHDPDFHSVTWAALGDLGLCPDGHPRDKDGAGLWPVAMHNWVVRNMTRKNYASRPRPFDSFAVNRQQRFVAIGDVLSFQELRTVRFSRGKCMRQRVALGRAGEWPLAALSDRQVAARLLQHLLTESRDTLAHGRVRGEAAIEARLFDISLQLTALAAREARQQSRQQATLGRLLGLSRGSTNVMREDAPEYTFADNSEPARILRAAVEWRVSEWMTLSPERRLFIFDHARKYGGDPVALNATALGIIDRLIADGDGTEVDKWIAHRDDLTGPEGYSAIWSGERGQALLALDRESGFSERAVIAMHRGVSHLERGEMPEALRSMAYAMQFAHESRASETVQPLSRRWLSYVAGQFEITDALLVMLQEMVPRREYTLILEDLMWRAAFHADLASFERGIAGQQGRGALGRRIDLLYPLARGDLRRFTRDVRKGLRESPSETLRLLDQLVQRLELEDGTIRVMHLPTLERLRDQLAPLAESEDTGRQTRSAGELIARMQAITEGLEGLSPDASERDRARSLSPTGEVFAGSVRLAPADALPWPFRSAEIPAPSIFTPLGLTPQEWRDGDGDRVFGWRIDG
jgi:hypothetical protein